MLFEVSLMSYPCLAGQQLALSYWHLHTFQTEKHLLIDPTFCPAI